MIKKRKSAVVVGQVYPSRSNGDFKVLEYAHYRSVRIEFLDTGYQCTVRGDCVIDGRVKDKLRPTVCGVGYVGEGIYEVKIDGKITQSYVCWSAMLHRCYGTNRSSREHYNDCSVHPDWFNYQNFAAWCDSYPYQKEGYELDKDLKIKGNRQYSPGACSFVPLEINRLFSAKVVKPNIGTYFRKDVGKYTAQVAHNGQQIFLGYHETAEAASGAYETAKAGIALSLANKYKTNLDPVVFEALCGWFEKDA